MFCLRRLKATEGQSVIKCLRETSSNLLGSNESAQVPSSRELQVQHFKASPVSEKKVTKGNFNYFFLFIIEELFKQNKV